MPHALGTMQDPATDLDAILMQRVAARDPAAFRALADKYMPRSLRFIERLTGSRATAEDVVQEAFEAVWKQAPQWKPLAKFSTWFYRVLNNLAQHKSRDRLRLHEEVGEYIMDDAETAEEHIISFQQDQAVKAALQELPERQRLAIVLFYYENMGQREACDVMGVSEGAFESLLSRGRAQLKQKLSPTYLH